MTEESLKIINMLADYADGLKQREVDLKETLLIHQKMSMEREDIYHKAEKIYTKRIENSKKDCIALVHNLCKQLGLPENEVTDWITCFENVFK